MAASACCSPDVLNGGTIINSTIVNSQLTNSSIQGSEFVAGKISNSTIDASTLTNSTMTGGRVENAEIASSTITTPNISDPTITHGTATETNLVDCSLESLVKIDDASASLIADALASLPADSLTAFAHAILSHLEPAVPETIPVDKTVSIGSDESISTSVAGDRTTLLGAPDKWISLADGAVPVYRMVEK